MNKKIAIGIFLTLVLAAISTIPTMTAHTEDDPLIVDLIAGGGHGQQNGNGNDGEDAGDVLVWNDEDTLYIKYVSHDPWVITETHLHVALSMGAIPQKNGNPIPGKFENKDEWNPPITEVTYTYNLEDWAWIPGTELYIAAHAVVMDTTCYNTGVVYGIERYNGNVWGVDVLAATSSLEFTIPNPPGGNSASPNGLAYNTINGYFYYTDYTLGTNPDTLYFWDGTSQTVAGQVAYGTIACGDISNGKYYYIPTSTDDLYEITFNSDGTIATDTKLGDISGDAHSWTFNGDIAVKDGVVYGWGLDSHGYEYFTYDLTSASFFLVKPTYQSSLQLAFGSNGELYGHRSGGNGAFYEIDITNGEVTLISEPGVLFTDCASGEICVPITETAWGHGFEFPGKNWATYFKYTIQETTTTIRFPEDGNAYIGYEDWYNGDFDYNDFGMTFYVEETYVNDELTELTMEFTAVVYDSGMDHLIHILRPLNGDYEYTITRSTPAYPNILTIWDGATGQETPAGAYTGSGDLDVTLFNTQKYTWPQKQIGETVTINVILDDPSLNPKQTLTPPRSYNVGSGDFYDLDPIMANYDPWEEGTLFQCRFHIDDTQIISDTSNQKYYPTGEVIPTGTKTPLILVVPYTDWIPPYEDSTITGPYGLFNDFYTTGSPANWYETITNPAVGYGGLSWS